MTFLTGHDELFAAGEIGLTMSIGAILEDKKPEAVGKLFASVIEPVFQAG